MGACLLHVRALRPPRHLSVMQKPLLFYRPKLKAVIYLLLLGAVGPWFVWAQTQTRPTVRNPHASLQHCKLATGIVIKHAASRGTLKIDGWVSEILGQQLTVTSIDPVTNSLKPTTVNIDQETEIVDRYRCYTFLNDLVIGDRVQLYATARNNGTAELIRNQNSWIVKMTGRVENPNPANQTFTFAVGRHSRESIAQTRVDSITVIDRDGQRASFADLTHGTTITMIGRWNRTTQSFLAARITILTPVP